MSQHVAPSTDVCTCDPICTCSKGVPQGPQLITFAQKIIATAERDITLLGTRKYNQTRVAALRTRVRRAALTIRHEQLKADYRAEYAC